MFNQAADVVFNRGLPFHAESEQAVLGAILLDPIFAIPHTIGYLTDEDFFIPLHRRIFGLMRDMHRGGVAMDTMLLSERLKNSGVSMPATATEYIVGLMEFCPTAGNVRYYARLLRRESDRRRRILKATADIAAAYTDDTAPAKGYVLLADVLEDVLTDTYARSTMGRYSGYTTGFNGLDEFMAGLQQGELYIVAGRPSMGKSVLCAQIAGHISGMGGRVAYFPLENGATGLVRNMAAMSTHTAAWKLRSGKAANQTEDEKGSLCAYLQEQRKGCFVISMAKTPAGVEKTLYDMCAAHGGVDVVFIDHLQEMFPSQTDKWAKRNYQLEGVLQDIRLLARSFNVPVILAAQVGRSSEGREPSIAEIKDSGSIEQIADVILVIHGPERGSGQRTITVAKNRNGAVGKINLRLHGDYLRLEEGA